MIEEEEKTRKSADGKTKTEKNADENVDGADIEVEAHTLVGEEPSEEALEEVSITDFGTYGDRIIDDFSVESQAKSANKHIKIPETAAKYVLSVLYIALGAVCAAIPARIESVLPYVVGGGLLAISLVRFIFAIIEKEYRNTKSNRTASALILIGLSVMILIEHEWAHTFIPIVWGVLGLCEGAHAFNHALSRISRGMRSSYYIIKGIVEVAVAFLLLYKPEEYGELHIIVFGVSLIIDGITTLPALKKLFTKE
ncbi:MAG: DUF308 domain-containing protein [Clostridia bacterium]|nr:DUF308 domain-containing protein [Clostridia bacterium]